MRSLSSWAWVRMNELWLDLEPLNVREQFMAFGKG